MEKLFASLILKLRNLLNFYGLCWFASFSLNSGQQICQSYSTLLEVTEQRELSCGIDSEFYRRVISRLLLKPDIKLVPESPVQFFFWGSTAGNIYGKQELLEIYEAILICVKSSEDMITEFWDIPRGETLAVDLHEGVCSEPAIWAILLEPLEPLLDCLLIVPSVGGQPSQVRLGQIFRFGSLPTHSLTEVATDYDSWHLQVTF